MANGGFQCAGFDNGFETDCGGGAVKSRPGGGWKEFVGGFRVHNRSIRFCLLLSAFYGLVEYTTPNGYASSRQESQQISRQSIDLYVYPMSMCLASVSRCCKTGPVGGRRLSYSTLD